ncbi:MAG TPA: SDR family NAD(P)-dependent oxidoreductase [Flavobacteriia bacterium]|nr:SDR family NAD(P)-dependent oxidoreductase [Flavobacteriia bacterium]
MNLKNKVAIVTGASKGIGLATVKILLENNVKVTGWSRSKTDISHPDFLNIQMDIRDIQSVEDAYKQAIAHFGKDIHILINNAGLGFTALFEELKVADWHQMFDTNVNGIFYATRLVLPQMKKIEEGHIINISSIAGNTGIETLSGYCATKFAVRGLSQALYKEVRNFGVKVTCIYPGSVQTNFFDKIDSITANENMMQPGDIASTILHCLTSSPNYHHVEIEVRPLQPKGKVKK